MNEDVNNIMKLYAEAIDEQPQMDVDANGNEVWLLRGKRHRDGAPAIITRDGHKAWWLNGELHREDGAAIELIDGHKEWYLHDRRYDDAKSWAEALLQSRNEPSSEKDVDAFLYNLNKKKVNELM